MPELGDWLRAVGLALTGERLDADRVFTTDDAGLAASVGTGDRAPSASAVVDWLVACGWTPHLLQRHREELRAAGQAWPHPVSPVELLGSGQAARLHALLGEVRALTGTDGLITQQRPERRVLGAVERRLLADVPPHYGAV